MLVFGTFLLYTVVQDIYIYSPEKYWKVLEFDKNILENQEKVLESTGKYWKITKANWWPPCNSKDNAKMHVE